MKKLSVTNIWKCRAGINPLYRVVFSDGNQMQSNEQPIEGVDMDEEFKLMREAIERYEMEEHVPIGATSHEDLYY